MTTLCKNCRYIRPGMVGCLHPANMKFSLVDGEMHPVQSIEFCRERAGHCGPDAKNFSPILEVA